MSMRLVDKDFRARPTPVHVTASSDVIAMQLTSLVSRETEMAKIRHMLLEESEIRLLTLTGMGGIGKTRLALATAYSLAQSGMFTGGIYVISLATVREALEVAPRIAQALNISQGSFQDLSRHIKNYLNERGPVLLVLDNCETVLDAGSQLVYLMANCPQLKVLMTSRRAFRVRGEHEFTVPPLALPPVREDLQAISQYPAVQLFIERARAVRPDFALSEDNIETVAKICQRLEGLPLAIELAAPRLKLLSLEALLARLEQRLDVLRGGSSDMPTRHQTMQASLEWSYELLSRPEKLLLQRLSIFAPSWSLEAVEAICADAELPAADLMDLLEGLVNHSLVVVNTTLTPPRYRLLEIIRQFATTKLNSTQNREFVKALEQRHYDYYLGELDKNISYFDNDRDDLGVGALEQNYHNYTQALKRVLDADQIEAAMRLVGSLGRYWVRRNLNEGLFWLRSVLERRSGQENPKVTATALLSRGSIAYGQGNFAEARVYYEEALALLRQVGTKAEIARALNWLASAVGSEDKMHESIVLQKEALQIYQELNNRREVARVLNNLAANYERLSDLEAAREGTQAALAIFRELGSTRSIGNSLSNMGFYFMEVGRYEEARRYLYEGVVVLRQINDYSMLIYALNHLACHDIITGNTDSAEALLAEGFALIEKHGSLHAKSVLRANLGRLETRRKNYTRACQLLEESLSVFEEQSYSSGLAICSELYADALGGLEQWERAVMICGSAQALREAINMPARHTSKLFLKPLLSEARNRLGDERYEALWNYGRRQSCADALKLDLRTLDKLDSASTIAAQKPEIALTLSELPPETYAKQVVEVPALLETVEPLSDREAEVLQLLAQGLTNAQIAERLIVSKHTVSAHLRSIFAKLNVSSRTAAARFAVEFKL
jgi:predicted ATPase/DNA-binding CsgD family transcriptional regulator